MHALKSAWAAAVLALLLAAPAGAESEYSRTGFYLGAGGLLGFENFDGGSNDPGGGFDLRLGYHFTPHLAAEAQFSYVDEFDYAPGPHPSLNLYMATVNLKAILEDSTRLQPFVLVGVGFHNASFRTFDETVLAPVDRAGSTVKFGGGLESVVSQHVSVVLDASYNLNSGSGLDLDAVTASLGFRYRF